MGKTPGKWIKTLFLGKKSSKSDVKSRDILKSANRGESLISSKAPVSDSPVAPPLISPPTLEIGSRNGVGSEQGVAAELPNDEVNLTPTKEDGAIQKTISLGSEDDPNRIRHIQAATKAQAAFRGYRARLAFRTLKGIIRLQALIRGHLVRRQAVATLLCVQQIVKFQALARGKKVRRSDIGIKVQKMCSPGILGANFSNLCGIDTSSSAGKLPKNAIIQKLLASSPTVTPLRLSYEPVEPNSAWQWLERWTKLLFWEPHPQSKKNTGSKSQTKRGSSRTVETESGMSKRNARKSSTKNTENGSIHSTSESEKPKRNSKKLSSHPSDSGHEHSQNDFEKAKRNLRKVSNSTKEVSDRLEVDNEKPKHSLKKLSNSATPDIPVHVPSDSAEKMDVVVPASKQFDSDTNLKLPEADGSVDELPEHPATELQPMESNGRIENIQGTNEDLNSKDPHISNENQKTTHRRASLPAKIDHQENGLHSSPKVPSYMAPTESAKARLRGQGSPRFVQDGMEKSSMTRRHSLPSSTNGKLSSLSPRVPRLVQAAGKGVVRADRSLTSSRDGGDKAEWRR